MFLWEKAFFCRKNHSSAVCSGGLRIMNGSLFLDDCGLSALPLPTSPQQISFWEFRGQSPHTQGPDLRCCITTLKALTSLNKEVRPFFLGDKSIWSFFPAFLPIAITAFGDPEGYFRLAIIAFGAFGFIVPKYFSPRKNGQEESRLLNLRRSRSSKKCGFEGRLSGNKKRGL